MKTAVFQQRAMTPPLGQSGGHQTVPKMQIKKNGNTRNNTSLEKLGFHVIARDFREQDNVCKRFFRARFDCSHAEHTGGRGFDAASSG
jgi:hypothetical protein